MFSSKKALFGRIKPGRINKNCPRCYGLQQPSYLPGWACFKTNDFVLDQTIDLECEFCYFLRDLLNSFYFSDGVVFRGNTVEGQVYRRPRVALPWARAKRSVRKRDSIVISPNHSGGGSYSILQRGRYHAGFFFFPLFY
jgi:hypothetical protein